MSSPNRRLWLLLGVAAIAGLTLSHCKSVPLTAPSGATFTVAANPTVIPADGGESTITVTAFKSEGDGGSTVPDGTQFFFTTSLGLIDERVGTENGIARATLKSDGRAGTANIAVTSGTATLTGEIPTVEIGAGGGDNIITVVANPAVLGPEDLTSEIVATVTDSRGNTIPNVPLIFSTTGGSLASQGSILRTNQSGQAFDRLTLLADETQADITVSSGSTPDGTVSVTRASFDAPIIDFVSPSSGSRGQSLTVTIGGQNFIAGATVSFGAGIGIEVITFVNTETLRVEITIDPNATTGSRDVTVTNQVTGTNTGTLSGAFTIF